MHGCEAHQIRHVAAAAGLGAGNFPEHRHPCASLQVGANSLILKDRRLFMIHLNLLRMTRSDTRPESRSRKPVLVACDYSEYEIQCTYPLYIGKQGPLIQLTSRPTRLGLYV